jgi:acyl-CoA synthetase (AMP-forming)/AMP-acid ligase II
VCLLLEDKILFLFILKINGITDKSWSFLDLLEESKSMAKVLHGAGVKQNDVIAIIAENRIEFPAIAFGAFFLNAIVAPLNVTYTESNLKAT